MNARATTTDRRDQGARARARAIVRFNALMFHGLAAASFLETAAPPRADRLTLAFADLPGAGPWIEQVWRSQRSSHGRALRDYIEATWPEFDWAAAYDEFHDDHRARFAAAGQRGSLALEALRCCAREAQVAVCYRTLAGCADEPALHALLRQIARDHAGCFDQFRSIYERCARWERVGFAAGCRTILDSARTVRDEDISAAFQPLARHWSGTRLIAELTYEDFLGRMGKLIRHHAELGRFERLLFRPWLQSRREAETSPAHRPASLPQLGAAGA